MSAVIQINGTPGSRDNLPLGVTASLSNADNTGVSALQWKVLDSPKDLLGNTSVQAPPGTVVNQTLAGGFSAFAFIPDVTGEYLIQLTVTDLTGTTTTDTQVMSIREVYGQDYVPAAGRSGAGMLFDRGWAEPVNLTIKKLNKQVGIVPRVSVVYNGGGSLARGTCVKITGVVDGRNVSPNVLPPGSLPAEYVFQVDVATAADSGIATRSVLVLDTALNTGSRFGKAIFTGMLDSYNVTANLAGAVVGQLVYMSNTGTLALSAGTASVVVGEVAQTGTVGALFINGLSLARGASGSSLPAPSGMGKMLYDTGAAYAATAAGATSQVLHGNLVGAPFWSSVVQADVDNGYINLVSNQTAAGNKTFSNNVTINGTAVVNTLLKGGSGQVLTIQSDQSTQSVFPGSAGIVYDTVNSFTNQTRPHMWKVASVNTMYLETNGSAAAFLKFARPDTGGEMAGVGWNSSGSLLFYSTTSPPTVAPFANGTYSLGTASLAWNTVYAKQYRGVLNSQTTSGAVAIDFTAGNMQFVTASGNVTSLTISLTGAADGQVIFLVLKQDAAGTSTWPSTITNALLPGGTFGKTTAANAVDVFRLVYSSTLNKWLGQYSANLS